MPRFPQVKENVPVRTKTLPAAVVEEAERLNAKLDGSGRVLVRAVRDGTARARPRGGRNRARCSHSVC